MSIFDYITKHARIAHNQNTRTAARLATSEAYWHTIDRLALHSNRETPIWKDTRWDICIVLDAARTDVFAEAAQDYDWLPDNPGSIWSVGSMSPEWIGETFRPSYQSEWADCGYVTANPFSAKPQHRATGAPPGSLPLSSPPLPYLDEVWRDQWQDEPVSVVPPSALVKRLLWAWEQRGEYEMQKIVGHAMQPHIPFRSRPEWFGARHELEYFGEPKRDLDGETDIWIELRNGNVDRDDVWDAYLDNMHWGLDWVDWIRQRTTATIAITSDHGNGMGEGGVWSHPPNKSAPILRRVPWVLVEGTGEREWNGELPGAPPVTSESSVPSGVSERLSALGYRE